MAFECMKDAWNFIEENYSIDIANLSVVRNGDLIKVLKNTKLNYLDISKILIEAGKKTEKYYNQVRNQAEKIHKQFKVYSKKIQAYKHIGEFLNEPFSDVPQELPSSDSSAPSSPCKTTCQINVSTPDKACDRVTHPLLCSTPIAGSSCIPSSPSSAPHPPTHDGNLASPTLNLAPLNQQARCETRSDCISCLVKTRRIHELVQERNLERNKNRVLRNEKTYLHKTYNVKRVNDSIRKKNSSMDAKRGLISSLRSEVKSLTHQNSKLTSQLSSLLDIEKEKSLLNKKMIELEKQKLALENEVRTLRKEKSSKEKEVKEFQIANEDLNCQLLDVQKVVNEMDTKKNKKQYNEDIRLLVFYFLT